METVSARPGIEVRAPVSVREVSTGAGLARLMLADGETVTAPLAIGADGRGSLLRKATGAHAIAWRYPQTAIVCTIAHERGHDGDRLHDRA